jgi:hypothetical protein
MDEERCCNSAKSLAMGGLANDDRVVASGVEALRLSLFRLPKPITTSDAYLIRRTSALRD